MDSLSCCSSLCDIRNLSISTVPEPEGHQRIETKICDLPDDLLLQILRFLPTKETAATTILSKRWRQLWTMLPVLYYIGKGSESIRWFIEKSLQLHKAPKLFTLIVTVCPSSPVDVDLGICVENAVNRGVILLAFSILWKADPTSFPKSLYTCDTLSYLLLSNEVLVDVSSQAHLPSLSHLFLDEVVYKDEDSLVNLLSSSPVLKQLKVYRRKDDNLTNFTVKVASLQTLVYTADMSQNEDEDDENSNGSLVIDSPALINLALVDERGDYCLIENMPCLDVTFIHLCDNLSDTFLRSLSSVIHMDLFFLESMVAYCNAVIYSSLVELNFCPGSFVDCLDPLMVLLHNSPKLKSLTLDTEAHSFPLSWNQPSSIPGCLSSYLEIFRWKAYGGTEDERQLMSSVTQIA
ncbi:hypothetical protein Rs2_45486 [Raphanus sativus]|nr:hypothetical protein Rs2_45486 [Raphanus sativus]